jgi:hypothetical protein
MGSRSARISGDTCRGDECSLATGGVELLPTDLVTFVTESNRIEGIHRTPSAAELRAHCVLLAYPMLSVHHLEAFVDVVAPGKPLRRKVGMNVRVGNHIAPPGGPEIAVALEMLLDKASRGVDPHTTHLRYETLHPFMDGNGRSGRALWLWQMLNQQEAFHALRMGFLHLFYYQTLAAIPSRSAHVSADPG